MKNNNLLKIVMFFIVATLMSNVALAITFSQIKWGILIGNFVIIFFAILILSSFIPGLKEQLNSSNGYWSSGNAQKYIIYFMLAALSLVLSFKFGSIEWIYKALNSNKSISWLYWFDGGLTVKPIVNIAILSLIFVVIKSFFMKDTFKDDNTGKIAFILLSVVIAIMSAHAAAFDGSQHVDEYIWDMEFIVGGEKFLLGERDSTGHSGYYNVGDNIKYGILATSAIVGGETHYPLGVFIISVLLYSWLLLGYFELESKGIGWALAIYLAAMASNGGTGLTTVKSIAYILFIFVLRKKFEKTVSWEWAWSLSFAIVHGVASGIKIGGEPLAPLFPSTNFIGNMIVGYFLGAIFESGALDTGFNKAIKEAGKQKIQKYTKEIAKNAWNFLKKTSKELLDIAAWFRKESAVSKKIKKKTKEFKNLEKERNKLQNSIDKHKYGSKKSIFKFNRSLNDLGNQRINAIKTAWTNYQAMGARQNISQLDESGFRNMCNEIDIKKSLQEIIREKITSEKQDETFNAYMLDLEKILKPIQELTREYTDKDRNINILITQRDEKDREIENLSEEIKALCDKALEPSEVKEEVVVE